MMPILLCFLVLASGARWEAEFTLEKLAMDEGKPLPSLLHHRQGPFCGCLFAFL